jgi:tetratricopeptide (TPR) repeat protein
MNKQEEKDLQIVIAKHKAEKTKELLQSFDKAQKVSYKKWLVAASFVTIVSVLSFWLFNNPSSDELFSEYFSPYENVIHPISRTDKVKDIKTIAFENYELGNYTDALLNFDSLLSSNNEENEIIKFYKAVTYLKLSQPNKAIDLLKGNLQHNLNWRDKNDWYLALAYLKTSNITESKKVLLSLSQLENNFKKNETLLLLKSLK